MGMALTKRMIDSATYKGQSTVAANGKKRWSRDIRWDDKIPGFGLIIYPSGRKAFVLNYRGPNRRERLITIGLYGPFTVHQARDRAHKLLVEVKDGGDPLKERRALPDLSVREFADRYMERHSRPQKRTWKEDERRLKSHILPAFGSRALTDVRRADITRLHSAIGAEPPVEANRVLTLVGGIFAKAESWGYVPEGHPNPARGIGRFKERSRDRWLRPEEVERLLAAVAEETDPYVRAAFRLYLQTGLRKGELLQLQWQDIDFKRAELRIPYTKSGRPHSLSLTETALAILLELPRSNHSDWVFPGHGTNHRKDLKRPWQRIRKRAGLDGVTIHDLRRTVGSWMAQAGVPLQVIGEVLNHRHPDVTRIYARLAEDQGRHALQAVEHKIKELEK